MSRIVRIGGRYFLASTDRDIWDIALKVLNEWRNSGTIDGVDGAPPDDAREFVVDVCDSLDGETAWRIVQRFMDAETINPELI